MSKQDVLPQSGIQDPRLLGHIGHPPLNSHLALHLSLQHTAISIQQQEVMSRDTAGYR